MPDRENIEIALFAVCQQHYRRQRVLFVNFNRRAHFVRQP